MIISKFTEIENVIGPLVCPKSILKPQEQAQETIMLSKVCELCKIIYKLYEKKIELEKSNDLSDIASSLYMTEFKDIENDSFFSLILHFGKESICKSPSRRNISLASSDKGRYYYGYTQIGEITNSLVKKIKLKDFLSIRNNMSKKDYIKLNINKLEKRNNCLTSSESEKQIKQATILKRQRINLSVSKLNEVSNIYKQEIKRMEKVIDGLKGKMKDSGSECVL